MVFGVAGGIAETWGLPAMVVRIAFIMLALNGSGLVLYAVAVMFVSPPAGDVGASATVERAYLQVTRHQRLIGAGCIALGIIFSTVSVRWFGAGLLWPLAVVAGGFVVVWSGADEPSRDRWRERAARIPGNPFDASGSAGTLVVRLVFGLVLVIVGLTALVGRTRSFGALGQIVVASLVALAGLALVVGPWIRRLWLALTEERRARIRSEERAEVAAHLHDSVLQTLALVQRNPSTPREVAALARRQERDLRAWLYPERDRPSSSLAVALGAEMAEVEDMYGVRVHLVVVGDTMTDPAVDALVRAAREAAANAAVHAKVTELSVYAEVEPSAIELFVRDRGVGFDLATIGPDRRGVRESIEGRMRRHGGTAEIHSALGEGTEVVLGLKR
jgi:signal transduction histidine kinase